MNHATRKAIRTLLQLIVSGGLTALVQAVADLAPVWAPVVLAAWTVVVTYAQNLLESGGRVATILPSPPVPGVRAPLVAKTPAGVARR